jgi:hypothetical protein
LSSKGWSVERKALEQQYSAQLFEIVMVANVDEKERL